MSNSKSFRLTSKKKNFLYKFLRCTAAFLIPIFVGIAVFRILKIDPFGENDLLSVDLWGQYFPMYRQFAESNSFSEGMYSWNGALGFNNFVQSAFYCRSIFLLIFKFVPIDSAIRFIDYVCILRLGLSALTCQLFLEYKTKNKSPIIIAISVSYGLCAYALAFIMQFMWTDCIVIAPLVLLGLEKLFDGKSPILYIVSLALVIYTNFYVGYGVCLFTGLYFLSEIIQRAEFDKTQKALRKFSNRKYIGKCTLRFAVYSLIAGFMNAIVLIPTLKGLSLSKSANEGTLNFSQWYHTFAENINALLPETGISLEYGVANIATGLFMFILIPVFFFNTSIKFREKLVSGGFLFVLYTGLNYNPLDYVFNGFHFPNQLPGRWSFLFSLALVFIAARGISKLDGLKAKTVISSFIAGMFFVFMARYCNNIEAERVEKLSDWIKLLAVFCAVMLGYIAALKLSEIAKQKEDEAAAAAVAAKAAEEANENDKKSVEEEETKPLISMSKLWKGVSVITTFALAFMIVYDSWKNTVAVSTEVNGGLRISNIIHYTNAANLFNEFGEKYDSGDDDLYRVEVNQGWTFNDGQLGNFKSMTYYGSTLNGNTFNFMRNFGNRIYAQNVSTVYNISSVVQNSIFGIKYYCDRGRNLDRIVPNAKFIESTEYYSVWENETVLPVVFAASPDIKDFLINDDIKGLTIQNDFVNKLCGEDINVFEIQQANEVVLDNINLEENYNWNNSYFYCNDTTRPAMITYKYICQDENPIYIEHNLNSGQLNYIVNGEQTNIDIGADRFRYLGSYPAGTEIILNYESTGMASGSYGLNFYKLNEEKWKSVTDRFNSAGMNITSFKNTDVEGTVDLANNSMMFTTIPQDGGWKAYVDGKETDISLIANDLICFNVDAGHHEIELKYHCPGYVLGLIISLAALAAAVFCYMVWRKKNSRKNKENNMKPKVIIKSNKQ